MNRFSAFGAVVLGLQLFDHTAMAQIQPLEAGSLQPQPGTSVAPPPPQTPDPNLAIAPTILPPVPPPIPGTPPVPALRHSPRVMSLTAGYAYTPLSYLPLSPTIVDGKYRNHGLRIDWKAGWQVGGFLSGWHSYVGFFAGFFYNFGDGFADNLGLNYGIFAKHTIFPGRRFRPFLAYGLGAIQVWVRELGGRGIGHVTRLSLGLDTKLSERVSLEFDLSYQFNILPSFAIEGAEPRSFDFHSLSLTTGIWYGR